MTEVVSGSSMVALVVGSSIVVVICVFSAVAVVAVVIPVTVSSCRCEKKKFIRSIDISLNNYK